MANQKKKQTPGMSPVSKEILMLVITTLVLLTYLSIFHLCGVGGNLMAAFLFGLFGWLTYVAPVILLFVAGFILYNPENQELKNKILSGCGLFWALDAFLQWVLDSKAKTIFEAYIMCCSSRNGGGFLGACLQMFLQMILGRVGSLVVILMLVILFIILLTRKLIFASLKEKQEKITRPTFLDREDLPLDPTSDVSSARRRNRGDKRILQPIKRENVQEERMRDKPLSPVVPVKGKSKKNFQKKAVPVTPDTAATRSMPEIPETSPFTGMSGSPKEPVTPEKPVTPTIIDSNLNFKEDKKPEKTVYEEELERKFGNKDQKPVQSLVTPDEEKPLKKNEKKPQTKRVNEAKTSTVKEPVSSTTAAAVAAAEAEVPYQLPPLELLNDPSLSGRRDSKAELTKTASVLQETLDNFGVKVTMGNVIKGPSVTQFELYPAQGVKVSKIKNLEDDIKLSLAASDIRIEAPIPGKAAVGIEVPNSERTMVTLKELLVSDAYQSSKPLLTFAVGKDIAGNVIVSDIAKMPHLIIAGSTGSGKSVCVNTLILSILYKARPDEVKFIMVDPKMVELTAYEGIPHMLIPVVTNPQKAAAALNVAVQEMMNRYDLFAQMGVRDIKSFNKRVASPRYNKDQQFKKMFQIVIVVDEFADLMMAAQGEVESAVVRLTQLARAAGIHLVLATQRPSVNVITGLIKTNTPSRIALSVSSQVDSRTIIDQGGAEKLLGNGDMLFAPGDYPKPVRVQGAFVSDSERDKVLDFIKKQGEGPSYNQEFADKMDGYQSAEQKTDEKPAMDSYKERDALFEEAGRMLIEKEKASIGNLQRAFRIGFNRAARIVDQLCEAGVVGPEEGTKPRRILMTMTEFEEFLQREKEGVPEETHEES